MTRTEGNVPLRILTWHIHGSYLHYLSHTPCEFILPARRERDEGYAGRTASFPWRDNVHEVPAEAIRNTGFDCILFQSRKNFLEDQHELLTPAQRRLPKIYLEHDPPRETPTETRHVVDDPDVLLVHVTHFNALMWNSNRTPTKVIEHGVPAPAVAYSGELDKGIVVINNIAGRGRRLGLDVFRTVRERVPLDIVGMNSEAVGGLGEVPPRELPAFMARYRFFFNPIRYTSLGLAVCEAMRIGMPVIGLATTEMPTIVTDGVTGHVNTNIDVLVENMRALLRDPGRAHSLGHGAAAFARERFSIERFAGEWLDAFRQVAGTVVVPVRGAPSLRADAAP